MAFAPNHNPFSPTSTPPNAGEYAYHSPRQYSQNSKPSHGGRGIVYHGRQYADDDVSVVPQPMPIRYVNHLGDPLVPVDASDKPPVSGSEQSEELPAPGQLTKPRDLLSTPDRRLYPVDKSTISRDDTSDETLRYEQGLQLALGLGSFHRGTSWRASEETKSRDHDSGEETDEDVLPDDYPPYGSYRTPPPPTTRTTSYRYTGNGVYPDEARGPSTSRPTVSTAGGLKTLSPNLSSRGNPYAARSDFPPPPRRTQPGTWAQRPTASASTGGDPTRSGADRFTNFPNPQETTLRNDRAADRTPQFRAWQNMNNVRLSSRDPRPTRTRTSRQHVKMPTEEQIRAEILTDAITLPGGEAEAASRQSAWAAFQEASAGQPGMSTKHGQSARAASRRTNSIISLD